MRAVICRWFDDGAICIPVYIDGALRWFERTEDTEGPFLQEVKVLLPTARWWLRGGDAQLQVVYFRENGDCPDLSGKTPERRVFVDGEFRMIPHAMVMGSMPLRTRRGRLKNAREVREDFRHWAKDVKGKQMRRRCRKLAKDVDPDISYPEETALLDEVSQGLPDEHDGGIDP